MQPNQAYTVAYPGFDKRRAISFDKFENSTNPGCGGGFSETFFWGPQLTIYTTSHINYLPAIQYTSLISLKASMATRPPEFVKFADVAKRIRSELITGHDRSTQTTIIIEVLTIV